MRIHKVPAGENAVACDVPGKPEESAEDGPGELDENEEKQSPQVHRSHGAVLSASFVRFVRFEMTE